MSALLIPTSELGPVTLVGDELHGERLSRHLPAHWERRRCGSLDQAVELARAEAARVVVLVVDPVSDEDLSRSLQRLQRQCPGLGVVVAPTESGSGIEKLSPLAVENLFLPADSRRHLVEAILDAHAHSLFHPLAAEVDSAEHLSVWIRRIFIHLCLGRLPWSGEARRALRRGDVALLRTVRAWAKRVGASERFLELEAKASGVQLSLAIRHLVALRGLALYHPPVTRWDHIAPRVGFKDASGFGHFVRRALSRSPGRAVEEGMERWIGEFRRRIGVRPAG